MVVHLISNGRAVRPLVVRRLRGSCNSFPGRASGSIVVRLVPWSCGAFAGRAAPSLVVRLVPWWCSSSPRRASRSLSVHFVPLACTGFADRAAPAPVVQRLRRSCSGLMVSTARTVRSRPSDLHDTAAERRFRRSAPSRLDDRIIPLPLVACLRCADHPDRRGATGMRAEPKCPACGAGREVDAMSRAVGNRSLTYLTSPVSLNSCPTSQSGSCTTRRHGSASCSGGSVPRGRSGWSSKGETLWSSSPPRNSIARRSVCDPKGRS